MSIPQLNDPQAVENWRQVWSICRITVFVNGHIGPLWAKQLCGLDGGRGQATLDSILHKCHAKILAEMQFGAEEREKGRGLARRGRIRR